MRFASAGLKLSLPRTNAIRNTHILLVIAAMIIPLDWQNIKTALVQEIIWRPEFSDRIKTQAELVRQTRAERGISDEPLTRDACLPGGLDDNIAGKLVIIRPEIMQDDKRTADYQYFVAEHGNGCRAEALGLGVFGKTLYTGESGRWDRPDILGMADPEKLPDWAKERLKALHSEKQTNTRPRKKTEMER